MHDEKKSGRRDLFKGLARSFLAIGGIAGVGALTLRNKERCDRLGICRGCPETSDCGLPQALSFREAQKTEDQHGR